MRLLERTSTALPLLHPECCRYLNYIIRKKQIFSPSSWQSNLLYKILLQLGLVLGLVLAIILGVGLPFAGRIFTKDGDVLHLIRVATPVPICYEQTDDSFSLSLFGQEINIPFLISLLQLLNQSMRWPLFLMASILELLIFHMQHTLW